jgi:DNA-binding transcriptional MocR family regulator
VDPRTVELQKRAAERDDVIGLAGGLPADELLPKEPLSRARRDHLAFRVCYSHVAPERLDEGARRVAAMLERFAQRPERSQRATG